MEQMKIEKENLEKRIKLNEEKRKKLESEKSGSQSDLEGLIKETEELEIQKNELLQKEKNAAWNVDTISQPKFSKTVINKKEEKNYDEMDENEKEQHMKKFIKENEKIIKGYGMLRRFDDSKKYLMEHHLLVHEDTGKFRKFLK